MNAEEKAEFDKLLDEAGNFSRPREEGQSELAYQLQGIRYALLEAKNQWSFYAGADRRTADSPMEKRK